jgi:hypothetical protein|tara:strand:- start:10463 stop:11374 length:912 start_codon:yes stop_codon:yes gene_type:complete
MAQALRSRQSLYYVAEVTPGTTPATPTLIEIPIAGIPTLNVAKDVNRSSRINSNRQSNTVRHGTRRSEGEIPIELAYGDFDALFESLMHGTWATNVLKVGTTQKFFTLERRFPDISEFQPFTGCMMNTFSLSAQPNGMITGNFGVLGLGGMTPASATVATTSTATPGNEPFDGFTGTITEGGASANITALELSITNNGALPYVIGSDTAPGVNSGMFAATGTVTAFFETEALINKFLDETESALAVTFEGINGGDLAMALPRLKYTGSSITEADEGLLVSMPFEALYSTADSTTLTLTRTPAA